jgi:hypothetical protein
MSLCAVLIITASRLCVVARANSLSYCCSSDCRVGTGLVMASGGLPYISKPAIKLLAAPPPPGGARPVADLLLCLCCVYLLSGNSLHIAQPVSLFA